MSLAECINKYASEDERVGGTLIKLLTAELHSLRESRFVSAWGALCACEGCGVLVLGSSKPRVKIGAQKHC